MTTKKELQDKYNELLKENGRLKAELAEVRQDETKKAAKYWELTEKYEAMQESLMGLLGPVVGDLIRKNLKVVNEFDDGTMTARVQWNGVTFAEDHSTVEVYEPCRLDE